MKRTKKMKRTRSPTATLFLRGSSENAGGDRSRKPKSLPIELNVTSPPVDDRKPDFGVHFVGCFMHAVF
jgi:hypothetical protein